MWNKIKLAHTNANNQHAKLLIEKTYSYIYVYIHRRYAGLGKHGENAKSGAQRNNNEKRGKKAY